MRIVDMHCDTISKLYASKNTKLRENKLHIDIEKLVKGGYLLQNFALFVNLEETRKEKQDPLKKVLEMIDLYYEETEENKDKIGRVTKFEEIEENKKQGKLSAVLTVEEGGVCKGSIRVLRNLYRLGVRMLTLTWNYKNELGYPNLTLVEGEKLNPFRSEEEKGLTACGIEFLLEMERLGMIIDVSHLSDGGFYDVAKYTKKPFVASHSNARANCSWVRNLTDPMIRVLGERGGVTGLNFCPAFLEQVPFEQEVEGTISSIVDHANHIIKVGGIDCLGIGSDFDGIKGHKELPDASYMARLVDGLEKGGIRGRNLDKVLGENVLRVYKECWK